MGCGYEAACKDCKVHVNLGYGSYDTWMVEFRSKYDYDASDSFWKGVPKNMRWRKFLGKHDGHDFETWSEDSATQDGTKVVDDFTGQLVVDLDGYKQIAEGGSGSV